MPAQRAKPAIHVVRVRFVVSNLCRVPEEKKNRENGKATRTTGRPPAGALGSQLSEAKPAEGTHGQVACSWAFWTHESLHPWLGLCHPALTWNAFSRFVCLRSR